LARALHILVQASASVTAILLESAMRLTASRRLLLLVILMAAAPLFA